ncbi:MAG: YdcF family protein [Thermodesulfovibrionales bacterium]|nr:YdcF family protein [Thermodesulfovibrionales bacterium]
MPPGIFIVLLICTAVWLFFKRHWKIGFFNLLTAFLMWVLSVSPVSDSLFRVLESGVKIPEAPSGDVIVLLGGGISDGTPDLSGIGAPSEETSARIITAVRLQRRLDIPIIVSGGSVFKGRKAEAVVVKRFLIDLGVPANKVIPEDKSRDTIENARYSMEICRKFNYKKVILVTSAYHMKRAIMSFRKVGIDVLPAPANFQTWENKRYGWESYLPGGFDSAATAFREYLGLIFYKFAY